NSYFNMANDPVKMAETALGALMFLRGDVAAAKEMVERRMPHDWVLESLRVEMPDDRHPFWFPELPGRLALVHRTGIADFRSDALSPVGPLPLPQGHIVSDTGELIWVEEGPGRVLVDTPRHQAIVGHAGAWSTRNLAIDLDTPFAAVELASLHETPIADAEELLLLTAARVANTGMEWADATRHSLADRWGQAPTRIEPVRGSLTLRNLRDAMEVLLQPLDGRGQPVGAPLQGRRTQQGFVFNLNEAAPTLWYRLLVRHEGR
ncbi:MAG: hypothetical protein H5T69_19120, partial [Chloroflexi bacterium]|nr:hypothetical protein [Chloroflexota bacterium]